MQTSSRTSWYALFVLTLANISSFIDRQALSLIIDDIKRDLQLNDTQVSLLGGLSFALFYTFFGVVIGRLADTSNRRNIIIWGITIWSAMTGFCAGVVSYGQFFLARMGVGVGEATLAPSAYSMIADMFPKRRLATALSIYSLGVFLGPGLATLISAFIVKTLPKGKMTIPILGEIYSWQLLFLYIGLPGLIIALLLFTIKEPARTNALQKDGEAIKLSLRESLKIVCRYPKAYLLICFATAAGALVNYGSLFWIPTFVQRTFGWEKPAAGFFYGMVLLASSVSGVLFGGWYADRLVKNGVTNGRLRLGILAGILCTSFAFLPLLPEAKWALLATFVPSFALAVPYGATTAALQELMPSQVRSLASSIFLFILNLIGIGLGPTLVAVFTNYVFKDDNLIRYSLVCLYLIGGIFTLLLSYLALKPYREAIESQQ